MNEYKENKERYINEIRSMLTLPEHEMKRYTYAIDLLASKLAQYYYFEKIVFENGMDFTEMNTHGNKQKTVEYQIIETLRREISKDLKDLGLDKRSYEQIEGLRRDNERKEQELKGNVKEESKFEDVMSRLEKRYSEAEKKE